MMKNRDAVKKIVWSRTYHEDEGAEDAGGSYGYAYYYHIYLFSLPDRRTLRVRRYTDTPDQCSLFMDLKELTRMQDTETLDHVHAIINFLIAKEGVKKVDYFSAGYKSIDLTKVKQNLKAFTFEERLNEE
jgi:hypothetical protein